MHRIQGLSILGQPFMKATYTVSTTRTITSSLLVLLTAVLIFFLSGEASTQCRLSRVSVEASSLGGYK